MTDKNQFRRIQDEIRSVLLQTWDPIGIQNEPNAKDEYDGYVEGIYRLLSKGASDDELATHLWLIVTDRMGFSADKLAQEETVKELRKIRISP